jgi:hypothetical protein
MVSESFLYMWCIAMILITFNKIFTILSDNELKFLILSLLGFYGYVQSMTLRIDDNDGFMNLYNTIIYILILYFAL